jgi:MFS family permease
MAKTHVTHTDLLKKDFLAVLVLVVNAFSWYFPLYVFFQSILESQVGFSILLGTLGIHFVGAVGSAFAGTHLIKKFSSRSTFLSLWMLMGVISSAMLIILDTNNIAYLVLVSFILGISLGLGFNSCLAYFGDYTIEENRGRLGGTTFFASGLGILLIGLLSGIFTSTIAELTFILWRGLGLILFLIIKPKQEHRESVTEETSYKSILLNRYFIFYLIPWVMFCLVNFLENPIVNNFVGPELALLIPLAEYGIGGFSALICGWFADSVGRKRMVILGFIMLGIGYAILGLFSETTLSWLVRYLYIVFDGIAWGIFSLMFYLVIWADLAGSRSKEKYYLIGALPFLVSSYIQVLFTPYAKSIPIYIAFSLASFFLFLAVLPLLYAPETLSEKEIEKKRLKKYLEDVEKVKKKYAKG